MIFYSAFSPVQKNGFIHLAYHTGIAVDIYHFKPFCILTIETDTASRFARRNKNSITFCVVIKHTNSVIVRNYLLLFKPFRDIGEVKIEVERIIPSQHH